MGSGGRSGQTVIRAHCGLAVAVASVAAVGSVAAVARVAAAAIAADA